MYKIISTRKSKVKSTTKQIFVTLLLLLLTVQVSWAQSQTIKIAQDRPTVDEALAAIESQTGLRFFYDNSFDTNRRVELPKTSVSLSQMMDVILKGTGRDYLIKENLVSILSPKAEETKAAPTVTPIQLPIERITMITQRVEGNVSFEGAPVYGSVVSLSADGQEPFTTTTNIKGEFEFANVPAGEYKLNATHLDYGSVTTKTTIKQGAESKLNITLPVRTAQTPEQSINANLRTVSVQTKELVHGISESKKQALPRFAIKTNILYDALTNINFGFEVRLGNRLTLDVPVNYNPWVFANNKRLNNILVQPELRYWIAEPFNGHFFGLHGHFAHFNTGGITAPFGLWKEWRTSRYQGDLYGVGVSYGYQWILSRRLNLEGTLGVGYIHAKYDRFECQNCGESTGKGLSKNYFGPTKVGLSLIYIIK